MIEDQGDQEKGSLAEAALGPDETDDLIEEAIDAGDAGRMGKAIEHLVAAACILSTRGALNASTSLVDDEGVDFVFHARGSTRTLAVQSRPGCQTARLCGPRGSS